MSIEKWDILDSHGCPKGKTMFRGDTTLKPGEYHLVVHIWVISPNGDFLIQRRSESKKLMPGEWAATGGAAVSGENSYTAAHRELLEELGIDAKQNNLTKLARIRRRNSLLDVWATVIDDPIESLSLQESEVAEVKWVTRQELSAMIENKLFHNYGKDYFETVFCEIDNFRRVRV